MSGHNSDRIPFHITFYRPWTLINTFSVLGGTTGDLPASSQCVFLDAGSSQ